MKPCAKIALADSEVSPPHCRSPSEQELGMRRTVAEFLRSRGAALERKTEDGLVRRRFATLVPFQLFGPNDASRIGREHGEKHSRRDLLEQVGTALACLLLFLPFLPTRNFSSQARGGTMPLQISSTAFSAGETIPQKFTCDGRDVS